MVREKKTNKQSNQWVMIEVSPFSALKIYHIERGGHTEN